ncbi:MAG: PKD domain-containing protein [Bacteroidota bacterium]|nr:PKD domain-containing protein [Bacteroidota bacterium]
MKRTGLLSNVKGLGIILILGIVFTTCKKEPLPTVDLYITVDGFTVDIAAEALNTTSWAWDYGDGTVSDSVGSHSHTYAEGGNFTIQCTVTGLGGETTKTESVAIATIAELLSGGTGAADSKTWVLSRTAGGTDGVGFVKVDLAPDVFPAGNDMLEFIGVPDEYDNEYTFYGDGSYSIDNINGSILASWIYSSFEVESGDIVNTTPYGIFQINSPNVESATWSLTKDEDLVIESVYDADIDYPEPGIPETITFEKVDFISFEDGGFIGMKDYTSTAMIRDISADRMTLTVFFHSYYGDPANDNNLYLRPAFILTLSYDAK